MEVVTRGCVLYGILCLVPVTALTFKNCGTKEEPCYHFQNVFNESPDKRGKRVADVILRSFDKHGKKPPKPNGKDHWRSWKPRSPANGNALVPKAKELLAHLKKKAHGDWHVNWEPHRGFNTNDINVQGSKGGHGWHQDAQAYGSLLFLFVAGNDSDNVIRVRGKKSKDERFIHLRSGDCLVFEGQTWHAVNRIRPNTTPFKGKSSWLHNRRMSVLVRQKPPKSKPKRPHYLKK
jgi:hypothetical protein